MDFSLSKYRQLLICCQKNQHQIMTMEQFLVAKQPQANCIILRHDVDRRIKNALAMAHLEAKLGVKASYYFRIPYTFKPKIIQQIAALGHEIGFHYETLSKTKGNIAQAFNLFKKELAQLRQISSVRTICMHGSPLSSHDNRDLWLHHSFEQLGIIGEPYLSINYKNIIYCTDTGRSWASDATNLRDRVADVTHNLDAIATTDQLIQFINTDSDKTMIIQTHPERWSYSLTSFCISWLYDIAANTAKRGIRLLRAAAH